MRMRKNWMLLAMLACVASATRGREQMRRTSFRAALLAGALIAMPASAGSIEKLHAFIEQTRSAKANFTQEVTDANGAVQQ